MKYGIFIFLSLWCASLASASDLRGRVDGQHGYSSQPFPARKIVVTLLAVDPSRPGQTKQIASTLSGSDGLYYFSNVKPGKYIIQVNGQNYPITVASQAKEDIPLIVIRY